LKKEEEAMFAAASSRGPFGASSHLDDDGDVLVQADNDATTLTTSSSSFSAVRGEERERAAVAPRPFKRFWARARV
jgi:hypothetical protein